MISNENIQYAEQIDMTKRNLYTEKSFRELHGYKNPVEVPLKERILKFICPKESNPAKFAKNFFLGVLPILHWLPRYKVKKWLLADFISGLTVGIMHIPQGMSYALLAGQHPIYGLYNSFFPVILYTIFGTSRHTAMGCFALTSLMIGNAMLSLVPDPVLEAATGKTVEGLSDNEAWNVVYDKRILLGSACMFIIGIFLFALSILRVGAVVKYLSDPLISGFTFGAAVHIVVSQFKSLLGVSIGSYAGPLNLIWVLRDLVLALVNLDDAGRPKTAATVIISVICILFLIALKELNVKYKEKIPLGLPLPGEIVVVIVGTGISYGVDLAGKYGVSIIGNIPSGLPAPSVPPLNDLSSLVGYAIPIAVVGYSVSVSIAKIFGNKFGYEVRPNQELVAYGVSNTVCSFFSCFAAFPSMSRSCVQVESGGKTQVVGIIAAAVVLLVLLVIGPLFSTIPRACLASIICVAMKGMLKRSLDVKVLWKTSKLDMMTWLVTALGTLFLDVVYGLCVGVGFTLLCIVFRTQLVDKETLSRIGGTEIYRKSDQYSEMPNSNEICIGAFRGPLHYVNKEPFRAFVIKSTRIDPVMELIKRKKAEKKLKKLSEKQRTSKLKETECGTINTGYSHTAEAESSNSPETSVEIDRPESFNILKYFILDCSQIAFMDSVGAKTLATLTDDYKKIDIRILLGSCSGEIYRMLEVTDYLQKFGDDVTFISVHDAVNHALYKTKREMSQSSDNNDDVEESVSRESTRL